MAVIPVARLNHAVLFVRDATVAAEFYARVFGFEVVANGVRWAGCLHAVGRW